jgi:hypothetical protein
LAVNSASIIDSPVKVQPAEVFAGENSNKEGSN